MLFCYDSIHHVRRNWLGTMLEFAAYKKFKGDKDGKRDEESNHADEDPSKAAPGKSDDDSYLINESDQAFIECILAEADEEAPTLPPRPNTSSISWDFGDESQSPTPSSGAIPVGTTKTGGEEGKDEEKEATEKNMQNKKNRFFSIFHGKKSHGLEPNTPTTEQEADKEAADLNTVLGDLNLATKHNKAISLSKEMTEVMNKFTLVFKDLINGVPTAYDDLMSLVKDHDGVLSRNYEKLPSSLKRLITTLPNKLTSKLAPELLAVAAEAQGLEKPEGPAGKDELKEAAKDFATPANLMQLITKRGAIVGLLKGIVNALKVRWPAFMGTNVLWAVAISSKSGLHYCLCLFPRHQQLLTCVQFLCS